MQLLKKKNYSVHSSRNQSKDLNIKRGSIYSSSKWIFFKELLDLAYRTLKLTHTHKMTTHNTLTMSGPQWVESTLLLVHQGSHVCSTRFISLDPLQVKRWSWVTAILTLYPQCSFQQYPAWFQKNRHSDFSLKGMIHVLSVRERLPTSYISRAKSKAHSSGWRADPLLESKFLCSTSPRRFQIFLSLIFTWVFFIESLDLGQKVLFIQLFHIKHITDSEGEASVQAQLSSPVPSGMFW